MIQSLIYRNALRTMLCGMTLLAIPMPTPAISTTAYEAQQQKADIKTVTGTVLTADTKEPAIGATIQLKGTDLAAISDVDGKFSINVSGHHPVLVVSYLGMQTKEIPITKSGNIVITLEPANNVLEETVVVGSGVQKKVSVTGAISSVKASDLVVPSSNLSNAFAGRIAGVIAQQSSGEPGSGSNFYIRGIGTFGGRTTPLILLDDVEISTNDLNYVPAENIKSFSILKDASATAIYGARGANGVMIITTKTGDYNQKTHVDVTAENTFNFIDKFPDFADGATYMSMYNEAARARGRSEKYTQEQIERTASHYNPYLYPDVNWKDVLFDNMSMRQKFNINVQGGGNRVKYYMSLQVNHDNGLLNTKKVYSWNNNINIMNYTFQNNISYRLTPTTTIKMNMNAQIRQHKGPNLNVANDLFYRIFVTNPVEFPVLFPQQDGVEHIMYGNNYKSGTDYYWNPYATMQTSFKEENENTLNTVIRIDQDLDFITKGLKFYAWVNFKNWSYSDYSRSINPYYYRVKAGSYDPNDPNTTYELEPINTNGSDFINQSDIYKNSDQTFELQANLNYSRTFGLHNVGAMLIYKQREYRSDVLPNRNQGISGRLTYDYDHRYLAEFNFGYNGTERLAKHDRFGFFPAVSLGWVISNEKFFQPLAKIIDNLKIRGSYGLVGSDDLANAGGSYYLYIDKITNNDISYLKWTSGQDLNYTLGGPELTYIAQSGLGWEKVKKLDIGVDIDLFHELSLTFDYFLDRRYDIFMNRESWPQSLGYDIAKPWSNIGKMRNSGIELSMNYNHKFNKDLAMTLQFNYTYNQNKLTYQDEELYPNVWSRRTGKPYGARFGYISEGLFRSQEEIDNSPVQNLGSTPRVGDIKYRDVNGDGIIDASDQVMISKYGSTPHVVYGFGGTVTWKRWDFGIFFTGSAKRTIMTNGTDPFIDGGSGATERNVFQYIADNYWSEDNPNWDAKYPRLGLTSTDIANNNQSSTYWLHSGSFMRLKNIELGYSFKYGRIYASGANLLTFTGFKYWDPELSSWNSYPLQKVVNIGIQLHI